MDVRIGTNDVVLCIIIIIERCMVYSFGGISTKINSWDIGGVDLWRGHPLYGERFHALLHSNYIIIGTDLATTL